MSSIVVRSMLMSITKASLLNLYPKCPESIAEDSPMHAIQFNRERISLTCSYLIEKEGLAGCPQAILKCEINIFIKVIEM